MTTDRQLFDNLSIITFTNEFMFYPAFDICFFTGFLLCYFSKIPGIYPGVSITPKRFSPDSGNGKVTLRGTGLLSTMSHQLSECPSVIV